MTAWVKCLGRNRIMAVGSAITLAIVGLALASPLAAPHDPYRQYENQELAPPGPVFPLGTDEFGRDVLSRMLHGLRISLQVGVVAVALGTAAGSALGMIAGWSGGVIEALIMRAADTVLAYPPVLVGIGMTAIIGAGTLNVALAAAITSVPIFARLARAGLLGEREKDYVMAATALGAADIRILTRHVLPNITGILLAQMAVSMAFAVNLEAGLSFLGLGAQPPQASLGGMLYAARSYMRPAPWYSIFPGALLAVMLIGLNLLAVATRDLFDPRTRKQ